jgi:hypothetical protein
VGNCQWFRGQNDLTLSCKGDQGKALLLGLLTRASSAAAAQEEGAEEVEEEGAEARKGEGVSGVVGNRGDGLTVVSTSAAPTSETHRLDTSEDRLDTSEDRAGGGG